MGVRIEHVSIDDDRAIGEIAALLTAYWREVLGPDEPAVPASVIRGMFRADRADIDHPFLLARDGDDAVGFAGVDIRVGHGNEHMAWVEDLFVLPAHRRRGTGRALLDEVMGLATGRRRTLVVGAFNEGHTAGEAFARAIGGTTSNADRQNRVRVADLDRSMLERWLADAADRAGDYSLVRFDDVCPDELLDAVVAISNAMNDAPRPESMGDDVHDASHQRSSEAERAANGSRYWYVGARHDPTGQLAGYSEMVFKKETPWLVEQGDTAVVAAHRGHGIGRWLKAVNALRVLDEKPDARVIETWNDGTNRWMLAINDAMGFRPVATWVTVELQLP